MSPEIVPVPSDEEAVAIAVAMTGLWQAAPVVSAQVKARRNGMEVQRTLVESASAVTTRSPER